MLTRTLGVDLETFSDVDIQKWGNFRYTDSDAFEVLLFGYSWDGAPAETVDLTDFEEIPAEVLDALTDPEVVKTGWNCAFERYCLHKHLGVYLPPEQWEDTEVLAAQCGLPLKLSAAGSALKLPEDKAKIKEGKQLIAYFCKPCKPTKANNHRSRNMPWHDREKWEEFKAYNSRDVDVEGLIRRMLLKFKPLAIEHQYWCLDARINEKGIRVNLALARQAVAMDERCKAELIDKAVAISGIANPNSSEQVKAWLREQEDIEVPSLNKKVIADVVEQLTLEKAQQFMELRQQISKSSTKKYTAVLNSVSPDDHVRGCFQFYGASRTGRFAGRRVQLQNLPRNYIPDLEVARNLVLAGDTVNLEAMFGAIPNVLSELIRTVLIPENGHQFLVTDFSAIEARVLSWIAGEEWKLKVFRAGGDIYCTLATQMFGVPVEKHGINGELRDKGKVAELACGYGGAVNAMKQFGAERMGMSEEEMARVVAMWRKANPGVVAMWTALEQSAIKAITRKTVSHPYGVKNVAFSYEDGILWMTLPSGRRIAYWGARYEASVWHSRHKVLSYMGVNQKSKRWERVETWGGKLTENLVQATARDILRDKMLEMEKQNYDIRAHVHDEIIVDEPMNGRKLEELNKIMAEPVLWAPDLPLRGDGFCCQFYQKD